MARQKFEPINKRLARNIRRLRAMRRLRRAELAERAGITVDQLRQNERGDVPISACRLYWLGQALDVPLDAFFDRKAL